MTAKPSLSLDALPLPAPAGVASPRLPGRRGLAEFARYFVGSAVALAADLGLYRLALALGWRYWLAALLGFCGGAVVAYLASVRWVFHARAVHNAGIEFGLFVAVGVAGLLLTELLLWIAIGELGWPPLMSKLGASAIVFTFNFAVRKTLLFSARRRLDA